MGRTDQTVSVGQAHLAPYDIVCWSRMQTEAGQSLNAIIARKEAERAAGGGLFLWGVGNAPGITPRKLLNERIKPSVIFSVMKGRPKPVDVAPASIVAWRTYVTGDGEELPLPAHCLVTSRGPTGSVTPSKHYALFCRSAAPLKLDDFGGFDPDSYRNLGGTGAPVGSSQVTVLLRRTGPAKEGAYRINLVATLTGDLWVRLGDPVILSASKLEALHTFHTTASSDAWLELVASLREGAPQAGRARSTRFLQPAFL